MNETTRPTHTPIERRYDRQSRASSKYPIRIGEMTYLVLITVAAAVLTGVLALPFTMQGEAFAALPTAFGAADASPPASILTSTPLT